MADMLVDLVVAWHCKTWCAWCSSEPGDGFFNNRASSFSCNSKLCSRDSYGLKPCLVKRLLQCPYLHSSHDNLSTCCLEYELFPCNFHAFWTDNAYGGHIFWCGPSILHMFSSSLQASSLLSSRQPGTVCRNIQTCSKVCVKLSLHRNRTRKVVSRTKPPGLSISHPRKRKRQQFYYKSFGDMLPAQLSLNWWNVYQKVPTDCWCLGSLGKCHQVPLDPRCSYTLQGNGLRLVLSNLLLSTFGQEFSALPGLGLRQRYTLNISERKKMSCQEE